MPSREDRLIFLGDYIDRGPESARVIEMLLSLVYSGYNVVALRGNHEQMLLDSLADDYALTIWKLNSARKTLNSYGLEGDFAKCKTLASIFPAEHLTFLNEMPIHYRLSEKLWFVHGGIKFPNETMQSNEYLWLRPWEFVDSIPSDSMVIHGHTPIPIWEVERQVELFSREVNLDSGCVHLGLKEGLGYLSCLKLEERQLYYAKNME